MPEVRELPPGETAFAARALLELRPHRAPAEELVARIDAVQRPQGYRLLGSFDPGEAARLDCDQLHLDSGVEADRADAHRFYFRHGLRISSYHFARSM